MTEPLTLTTTQRETLRAICSALLPAMTSGEPKALFALSAEDLAVADAIQQAIAYARRDQQGEFRLLLDILAQPLTMMLFVRESRGFTHLDAVARERALLALAHSALPQLRTGFQVLKRLSTYLFYALPEKGVNPCWSAIGYAPSPEWPPTNAALDVTSVDAGVVMDCDACIVGSGAGGAVIAARLAEAGKRVVVLEAAAALQAPDFEQRELGGTETLFLERGLLATKDSGVTILAGAALGGGTVVNWQTSLRTPDDIREEWTRASGCAHFTSRTFTAALDAVCERLSVGTAESIGNANNEALRRGAAALGYHWKAIPRNARGCDPDAASAGLFLPCCWQYGQQPVRCV